MIIELENGLERMKIMYMVVSENIAFPFGRIWGSYKEKIK